MQLELKNLTKKYAKTAALEDYSFTFYPGIYGILGANGAGKTTLMNLLTDSITRDNGSITYNGVDILKLGKRFRKVLGYMPQYQGLYENMSAQTFLSYMAEIKGLNKKSAKAEIERILQITNLTSIKNNKIKGYSGGMRQRVLLAQALLGSPEVLILDEPTAGLDPKERIQLRNFISSISQDKIVLLATHIVSDIESISQYIIMMESGKIVKTGTPAELIDTIRDKVKEIPCSFDELNSMKAKYKIGNVFQKDGLSYIRIIGDNVPEDALLAPAHLTLEDVYLYYLNV